MSDSTLTDELTRIYIRDGGVQASVVLNDSRPEEAPLHERFEWNDSLAAERHRLSQARHMVRTATVRIAGNKQEALVNVPSISYKQEGVYKTISSLAHVMDEYMRTLDAAIARVEGAKRTLEKLEAVADGASDIDVAALTRIRTALSALTTAEEALRIH